MRVRILDIPPDGRSVRETLSPGWVDQALDGVGRGVDPGVELSLSVERVEDKVLVRGACEGTVLQECSRCLGEVRRELAFHVTHVLEPRPDGEGADGEVELDDGDLDVSYVDGPDFELDDVVREHLLLELPVNPLCAEGCQGLCPACGADKNETECACTPPEDPRWAALKQIKL